jgi:hypothetical protein
MASLMPFSPRRTKPRRNSTEKTAAMYYGLLSALLTHQAARKPECSRRRCGRAGFGTAATVAFGRTRQSEEIERLLTIEQVADSCQGSTKTVRRCLDRQQLVGLRLGGQWRILTSRSGSPTHVQEFGDNARASGTCGPRSPSTSRIAGNASTR